MGNSLNVGLRTGYLSVRTAGSTSDRRGMEARRINGHTYLLTYCIAGYSRSHASCIVHIVVLHQSCADTVFNIRILSLSVKNYPYPYHIRSDVVICYPHPIRIPSIDRETKKIIFGCSCNTDCPILIPR